MIVDKTIGFASLTAPPYIALILVGAGIMTLAIPNQEMTK